MFTSTLISPPSMNSSLNPTIHPYPLFFPSLISTFIIYFTNLFTPFLWTHKNSNWHHAYYTRSRSRSLFLISTICVTPAILLKDIISNTCSLHIFQLLSHPRSLPHTIQSGKFHPHMSSVRTYTQDYATQLIFIALHALRFSFNLAYLSIYVSTLSQKRGFSNTPRRIKT